MSYYAGITSDCWTPLVGTSDMLTTMRRTGELCTRPMVSSSSSSCRAEQVSNYTAITTLQLALMPGKFDLKNTVINIVAGLGLISFITMFCDFILLNYVPERRIVRYMMKDDRMIRMQYFRYFEFPSS